MKFLTVISLPTLLAGIAAAAPIDADVSGTSVSPNLDLNARGSDIAEGGTAEPPSLEDLDKLLAGAPVTGTILDRLRGDTNTKRQLDGLFPGLDDVIGLGDSATKIKRQLDGILDDDLAFNAKRQDEDIDIDLDAEGPEESKL